MSNLKSCLLSLVLLGTVGENASAFTFTAADGDIKGSFDSVMSIGTGIRASGPGCDTIIGTAVGAPAQPTGAGAPSGCLDGVTSGYDDRGNLNYKKGDAFTTYIKGTHELLLDLPNDYKIMARANWLRDFTATNTTGYITGNPIYGTEPQPADAASDLRFKARILDLWASKTLDVADQQVRIRVGNQVVSWGESLFIQGGINQTNAADIMRLSQPGTQLKEALLPAPIISVASGLGRGFNVEVYDQLGWNANYLPPVGSYWSVANTGAGTTPAPDAKNTGQYGVALRYQPTSYQANFGLYAMRYHDKSASLYSANPLNPVAPNFQSEYLQDRTMYGVSANIPVGNWAVGTELSYRPKDAVTLNTNAVNNVDGGYCLAGGKCYVEEEKYQLHLTGLLNLTPGDQGAILHLLGADSAMLLAETAGVFYPNLQQTYQGVPVASGQWGWGALTANDPYFTSGFSNSGLPPVGDKTSWGYNFDFSWTYDGSLIHGWQVSPEIFYARGVKGRTPNLSQTFMEGAGSVNYILTFTQNPPDWSVALNYAKFYGGSSIYDQPYMNRDFYALSVSRNF